MNTDAIVNAANKELVAGGGVCGAIFNKAGYNDLSNECRKIGSCNTENAVTTNGTENASKKYSHERVSGMIKEL